MGSTAHHLHYIHEKVVNRFVQTLQNRSTAAKPPRRSMSVQYFRLRAWEDKAFVTQLHYFLGFKAAVSGTRAISATLHQSQGRD